MRKLFAMVVMGLLALTAVPAISADLPQYPPPEVPPVDYGLGGSFYLRGTVDLNMMWSKNADYNCGCTVDITDMAHGYSFGAGIGYETGGGFRTDATLDVITNNGLSDGTYTMDMRTTLGLLNVYYDFGLDGMGGSAAGGWGAYVGAGLGGAYNQTSVSGPVATPDGNTFAPAGALMAGVTYDMGNVVTDIGYRMVYMPQITNGDASTTPFYVNQNFIHEIRGTIRYRFN